MYFLNLGKMQVMQAVSLSEYTSELSVLYAVDWLIGMFRTSVNIWGDACACVIVDAWEKKYLKKQGLRSVSVSNCIFDGLKYEVNLLGHAMNFTVLQ